MATKRCSMSRRGHLRIQPVLTKDIPTADPSCIAPLKTAPTAPAMDAGLVSSMARLSSRVRVIISINRRLPACESTGGRRCLLGMHVGPHGSGGADGEAAEHVRIVPLRAVGERKENRRNDAEGIAAEQNPLGAYLAREGAERLAREAVMPMESLGHSR